MSSKMPISLLRNSKTISYLNGMFAILGEKTVVGVDHKPLEKKVNSWIHAGSKRLDLNEAESDLFEQCSHTAYNLVSAKKSLSPEEKAFIDQHEFFFKN